MPAAQTPLEPAICDECGLSTTLPDLLQRYKDDRKRIMRVCPRCLNSLNIDSLVRHRPTSWILVGAVAVWVFVFRRGWTAGNLILLLPPIAMISVIWHELGHATVGRLLGLQVFRINLGIGALRFKWRLLGHTWHIHRYAFGTGGSVVAAQRTRHNIVAKNLAMTAAGPLANLLLAATAYAVLAFTSYTENVFSTPAPLTITLLLNAYFGVTNLFPKTNPSGRPNDGKLLLTGLQQPERFRQSYAQAYHIWKFDELHRLERPDEALAAAQAGVAEHSTSAALTSNLGLAQLTLGNNAAAIDAFEHALTLSPEPVILAIIRNNLAHALLLTGGEANLARSAELTAAAYGAVPWTSSIASTYALHQLRAGESAAASEVLEKIIDEDLPAGARKEVLYTLALAKLRLGESSAAAELQRQADELPGHSPLQQSLRSAIERGGDGPFLPVSTAS